MRNHLPLILIFAAGCGTDPIDPTVNEADQALARDIAEGLAKACPMAAPGDEAARLACSDALGRFALLRDTMEEPFLWGGQGKDKPLDLAENKLTRMNPLVWRKMYASLYMFGADYRLETVGTTTVLLMPFEFRGALDAGSYPYPFWHSKGKWTNYHQAKEIAIVIEGGRLLGGLRGAEQDPSRPVVDRTFDGNWSWSSLEGIPQPQNAMLYSNLFSPENELVPELDRTFRALEEKARTQNCNLCHSPDNSQNAAELVLLNYPNQALYARHTIVAELELRTMPPTLGVEDQAERMELIRLAKEFQAAAEQALALEGEPVSKK